MLIEDADRFGLAQLHQLRGRVGRGEHASHCILATDISSQQDETAVALATERLEAIESTMDGFRLAEVDLRQRGEGQLFGARQSGLPDLKLARVVEHQDTVKLTRDLAVEILDDDPDLAAWEHSALSREVRDRFSEGSIEVVQSG
jgi:ATP-dependent DNA helicase RecG